MMKYRLKIIWFNFNKYFVLFESAETIKNDENVLRLMVINALVLKWMKLSTARLHVSSEIVFNFLKTVSAILSV